MSNEQLMQDELQKAISNVDEVTTDKLSNEELELVAGGGRGPESQCLIGSKVRRFTQRTCVARTRRFKGNDLD
ncbi:hypothetical protein DSM106972_008320 [Dulcicalothrix desertica PCC 7102]|uniref:Uncharacterized protein n=1 Tax=Dulcicalothrix desertica PCC 7102 TaxID=232991 RepID=A0A433VRS6_9CYAN|nr:hypothetical protein [Dulcicalothrix desertica]RUT08779.1 hypothetical protein DSM106972_008320 [Dulcicalothrix desertica PCC 7102]TWH44196.1 hypothetical protein CAL7102_07981 [Dulcicalothrix desertica PCC 7102]TWH44200.1 hypothetical protein CAL7102_07986 [Dulcicalothrix desertica PCC 7102]